MVVESDDFDEVVFFFFVFFEVFLDDFFETVDNELVHEGGRGFFCDYELFVGLGVLVESFHVEESEGDVQFGAVGELFYPLLVHPLDLDYQQLAVFVHL